MTADPSPTLTRLARDAALTQRAARLGWIASALGHAGAIALVYFEVAPPNPGFELAIPSTLELGLTEAVAVEAAAFDPPSEPPSPAPSTESTPSSEPSMPRDLDAGVARDAAASAEDAPRRRRRDAASSNDATSTAPVSATEDAGAVRSPVAFLPAGGQIALRIDVDRIRTSPVRASAEALLAAIPDWQALIGESGIEPVRDLSRVLVATADLQRSSLVVAGRLSDEAPPPEVVVERMLAASGAMPSWDIEHEVRTTDWPTPDATARRVAILGARHFVIARAGDLERVLNLARARTSERSREADRGSTVHAAEALVSLPEGAAISLEVEGARHYVRRSPCPVPSRFSLRADERDDVAQVSLRAFFPSADESEEARACFETLRDRYAANPLVAFMGMATVLGALEIETDGAALLARTRLTYPQIRRILDSIRNLLRRAPADAAPGSGSSEVAPLPPPPPPPPSPPSP